MTFIIAIQSEDSIILASDTRNFGLDSSYQLQAKFDQSIQKSYLWKDGIFASNGIDQIGQQVYQKLIDSNNTDFLQTWLKQSAYHFSQQFVNCQLLNEQIICTQIYCSSLINNIPKLQVVSQSLVEYFGANEIRLMTYQKDVSLLAPLLQNLQKATIARHQFIDNISWMQYYLGYLQPIFYQINSTDVWVSQDFHIYFDCGFERFFGYIPNNENSQITFNI